jgi:hypothetical protein
MNKKDIKRLFRGLKRRKSSHGHAVRKFMKALVAIHREKAKPPKK